LFRQSGTYPYETHAGRFIRTIDRFKYHTDTILVQTSSSDHEHYLESVFVCLAKRQERRRGSRYYISAEYNLNAYLNQSNHQMACRFIFHEVSKTERRLYGLAELPGVAFPNIDYNIEELYLQRRENYETGEIF